MQNQQMIRDMIESFPSASEIFDRIYPIVSTSGGYYDAVVLWDPETMTIEVEQIPCGSREVPNDARILVHREKGRSYMGDCLEYSDIFSAEEISTILEEFGSDIAAFLISDRNEGGTYENRCKEAYRYYFVEAGVWDCAISDMRRELDGRKRK